MIPGVVAGNAFISSPGKVWNYVATFGSNMGGVAVSEGAGVSDRAYILVGPALGGTCQIYRSIDDAQTFQRITSPLPSYSLSSIAYGNNRFVAIENWYRVLVSTDNGLTWAQNQALSSDAYLGVTFSGTQFLRWGQNGIIEGSTSGVTGSWANRRSGGAAIQGIAVAEKSGSDNVAVAWAGSTLHISNDAGNTWSPVVPPSGAPTRNFLSAVANGPLIVAYYVRGASSTGTNDCLVSYDYGATWSYVAVTSDPAITADLGMRSMQKRDVYLMSRTADVAPYEGFAIANSPLGTFVATTLNGMPGEVGTIQSTSMTAPKDVGAFFGVVKNAGGTCYGVRST